MSCCIFPCQMVALSMNLARRVVPKRHWLFLECLLLIVINIFENNGHLFKLQSRIGCLTIDPNTNTWQHPHSCRVRCMNMIPITGVDLRLMNFSYTDLKWQQLSCDAVDYQTTTSRLIIHSINFDRVSDNYGNSRRSTWSWWEICDIKERNRY